jgi:hypothetical protein
MFFKEKSQIKKHIFCSKRCYALNRFKKIQIYCDNCKALFHKSKIKINKTKHHFCTMKCKYEFSQGEHLSNRITKKCFLCNQEFTRTEAHFNSRPSKKYYCSAKCKNKTLSINSKGFTPQIKKCAFCQKEFTIYKKNHRSRRYCSTKCQKNNIKKGKLHHLYKEIKQDTRIKNRNIIGYQYWRIKVLEKHNFSCLKCGRKNKLHAHHIESYATNKDKRLDVDNGAILCEKCHRLFHSTYGKTNNNKAQLVEFLRVL